MLWASPRTKAHCFSKLRDDALPRPTVLPARNFRRGDRQVCNGCRDLLSAESGAMIFANSQLRTHAEGCAAVRLPDGSAQSPGARAHRSAGADIFFPQRR